MERTRQGYKEPGMDTRNEKVPSLQGRQEKGLC